MRAFQFSPLLNAWLTACMIAILALLMVPAPLSAQEAACRQVQPVCDAGASVFAISAFDPVGSAVRIGEDQLVTSRHIVADQMEVDLFLPDGGKIKAYVVPSDYTGDIILLSARGLPPGPILVPAETERSAPVYTVGADISFRRIRAYDPGSITLPAAQGKPLARLHHTAYTQHGNSGGALVDAAGGLIGIVASGGDGRLEAVPATALIVLKQRSGSGYTAANAEIGTAIRVCTLKLDELRTQPGPLDDQNAKALETSCRRTGNRQYFDLAAQAFGSRRMFDASVALFKASLEQDPNSLNARLGLATTYHFAARYQEELPHLRILRRHLPNDPQVLRLAIQAGMWGDDKAFAQSAFEALQAVNPNMAPAAERFLKSPPPRPARQ